MKKLTNIARKLRKDTTETERYLWRHLRNRQIENFKFRRQHPIGRFIVDFVNLEKKLVIELDGGQHSLNKSDIKRDEWFQKDGYLVLRFWDYQVFNNLEVVLDKIRKALLSPHPDPLPRGEGKNV